MEIGVQHRARQHPPHPRHPRRPGQGRLGPYALALFSAAAVGVFLFALQDRQYRAFYATDAGQLLLALVIGLMARGYRFIGRAIEEDG